ncbi:helix-turn-helix transcriptional regulator [Tuanshanicoccus lijuaniae]|uniref:helix-turn-helix transcriptional regulator n=1 Tax=Aerococcaceae bacterium zg-1292 TaxID=2774330 RepID=UPI0019358EAE|nr:helix-turn-helix transcriptional regulator [Aerococcaceae bacterium zg-1292]QQA37024.1 helix-turn-helix transcriptional regulator [Aerococcaceae bacterium zg-1292]
MDEIMFLKNLINCAYHLDLACYSNLGKPSSNNNPLSNMLLTEEDLINKAILRGEKIDKPFILSNKINLTWLVAFEKENLQLKNIYFLGPVCLSDPDFALISQYVQQLAISISDKIELKNYLKNIPITPILSLLQNGIMLHYTLTKEKIALHQILPERISQKDVSSIHSCDSPNHSAWLIESQIMQLVEEGNSNFREKLSELSLNRNVGQLSNNDSLRQLKNMILASVVLVSRAAIRGGLSPAIAYPLSDYYIRSVEKCQTISELTNINNIMMEDFVNRVHQTKESPIKNKYLLIVRDYIDSYLDTPLSVEELAKLVNYSPYYLTRKFKKEFHIDMIQYIQQARLTYSLDLLRYSQMSIQEISQHLHFSSPSYFSKLFKDYYQCTPSFYRKKLSL